MRLRDGEALLVGQRARGRRWRRRRRRRGVRAAEEGRAVGRQGRPSQTWTPRRGRRQRRGRRRGRGRARGRGAVGQPAPRGQREARRRHRVSLPPPARQRGVARGVVPALCRRLAAAAKPPARERGAQPLWRPRTTTMTLPRPARLPSRTAELAVAATEATLPMRTSPTALRIATARRRCLRPAVSRSKPRVGAARGNLL